MSPIYLKIHQSVCCLAGSVSTIQTVQRKLGHNILNIFLSASFVDYYPLSFNPVHTSTTFPQFLSQNNCCQVLHLLLMMDLAAAYRSRFVSAPSVCGS